MEYTAMDTPIGKLFLYANHNALVRITFAETAEAPKNVTWNPNHPILQQAVQQLQEYFLGRRQTFQVPLAPQGSPFQQRVWEALRQIPYGHTISYQQLAEQVGNPRAIRAVGRACGANPIPVIIPCHRVVRKSGHLGGYAGGLAIKDFLLRLEKKAR